MKRLWPLLVAVLSTIPGRAGAADVVLVHPVDADPFIEEVFHRVRGELRARALSFEQEEGVLGALGEVDRQGLLERDRAVACLSFAWNGDASVVKVWVRLRTSTLPTLFEAVELQRSPEAPTLLAARAVDLLVTTLATAQAPPRAAPATPVAAPAASRPVGNDDVPAVGPWSLGAGLVELGAPSRWGAAWGPHAFVARELSPHVHLSFHIEGPLIGARHETNEASVKLTRGLALIEAEAVVARSAAFAVGVVGGLGAHVLRTNSTVAQPIASIVGERVTHWTPAAIAGLTGHAVLIGRLSLVLTSAALLLVPQPRVAFGKAQISVSTPELELSTALRWTL